MKVCKEIGIDLFIEDSYETCIELEKNNIKSILMTTKMNEKIDADNLTRVNNWKQIYKEYIKIKDNMGGKIY